LVVSDRDARAVARDTWVKRLATYEERIESPVRVLRDLILDAGLARGRVGIERKYVTAAHMLELTTDLPQLALKPGDDLLTHVRAVKTPHETAILQRAGRVTAEAIWRGFQSSKAGDTEKTVSDRIAAALFDLGADDIYLAVLGTGANTLHAHNKPGEARLQAGDLVRVDYGGKFDGFASDLARMGVVGSPSPAQADLYRRCRDVQLETIRQMRPGMRAQEVYFRCQDLYRQVGLDFRFPHMGHAFALGGHDYPMLHPGDTTELEPDMVFYVEPVYADPTIGMIQVEDLMRVTESDGELLTGDRDASALWRIPA
jgi:Xaa-Pro aminopeptidase